MKSAGDHIKVNGKDRKLGDEWLDWDGTTGSRESEIDEKPRTFLALGAWLALIFVACLLLGWYLTKPRIDQVSPFLSILVGWSAFALAGIILILAVLEMTLLLKFDKGLFPYIWTEKFFLSLLSKSMWLGPKLGVSRDRVCNSFIKVHNLILKGHAGEVSAETLLVLLPRCLQKETRQRVAERVNGTAAKIVVVAGGEEARKAIRQYKPSLILAVACERDLVSGIKDVAEKIHVIAIPNKRPEGPCKNTDLPLEALDDALKFITGRAGKAEKP